MWLSQLKHNWLLSRVAIASLSLVLCHLHQPYNCKIQNVVNSVIYAQMRFKKNVHSIGEIKEFREQKHCVLFYELPHRRYSHLLGDDRRYWIVCGTDCNKSYGRDLFLAVRVLYPVMLRIEWVGVSYAAYVWTERIKLCIDLLGASVFFFLTLV